MNIDEFYDEYFKDLADRSPRISSGAGNFVRITDFGDGSALQQAKDNLLKYPCLVLNEFDETHSYGGVNDRHVLLEGSFAILKHVDPDEGFIGTTRAVNLCRQAARQIFSKMIYDTMHKKGHTLYDNNITLVPEYTGNYINPLNTPGYRIEFKWRVTGKLITTFEAEWQ